MKKLFSLLLTGVMLVGTMVGCGSKEGTNSETPNTDTNNAKEEKFVGFAISYTGNSFMQGLADGLKGMYESKGIKCEVAVADGDATKQIEQIENFTTMGADLVVVMGVDPTGLTDVCKRAREAGTKVIAFTTDTQEQDVYLGSPSEQVIGENIAVLTNDWLTKTFGNNEQEVAIFGYTGTPEAANRTNGMKEKLASLAPNAKVTYVEPESNTFDAAQKAAENLFQTNPNIKTILCYNSGMALGVNAYVMSQGSAIEDKAKFGAFGADFNEESAANIKASQNNESIVRGVVSLGTMNDIFNDIWYASEKLLNNEDIPSKIEGKVINVTIDNVDEQK